LQLDAIKFPEIKNNHVIDNDMDCTLFCGDNLLHLSSLCADKKSSIGFCYIDPPYNCGSKFIYHDSRMSKKGGLWGKHASWMSFMLPRLVSALVLLKESGVIAISIDDYEFNHLKILMDHVFGEENFLGNIIVCRSKNGKGSKANIASSHEYLMIYGKTKSSKLMGVPDSADNYDKEDEFGKYRIDGLFRKKGHASLREDRPNLYYPLYVKESGEVVLEHSENCLEVFPIDSKGIDRRWVWSKETAEKRLNQLYSSKKGVIYIKTYYSESIRKKIRSIWDKASYYTERGTLEIKEIFGEKIFDTPKPIEYIKDIIIQMTKREETVLDFFAGTGTTADAVKQVNNLDGGSRKIILIESEQAIGNNHIAYSLGYRKISDITIKRLNKIKSENDNYNFLAIQ